MREFQHPQPVWRDRSDFVIGVALDEPGETEQLWARRLGDREFELCCVPLFAYGLALGDVVETDASWNVAGVRRASGRLAYRLWLKDYSGSAEQLLDELRSLGGLIEPYSANLVGVDASSTDIGQEIVGVFERLAPHGLDWEASR